MRLLHSLICQAKTAIVLPGLLAFGPLAQAANDANDANDADEYARVVEGWSVTAVLTEQTRQFEGCWMGRTMDDGQTISFLIFPGGEFVFAVTNPGWTLPKDEAYAVELLINGLSFGKRRAEVANVNTIYVLLNDLPAIRKNLKQGSRLTLRAPGKPITVSLDGTASALASLEECDARNRGSQNNTPKKGNKGSTGNKTPFVDFPKMR